MSSGRAIVFGNGGHARVVVDAMTLLSIEVVACIDEIGDPSGGREAESVPIMRSWRDAADRFGGDLPVVLAVGRNAARDRIAMELLASGVALQTICHPTAWVSPRATIGVGCYIGAKAIVNCHAVVGDACIVNSGACVEHHCILGNSVHLGPLAVVCGWSSVGARTFVGAAASVRDRINVGADAMVGMGAVVVSEVAAGSVVVGCPARVLRVAAGG
jgi:sugar O-acyltransferase (sialic acid O-acetyltransferase NeuD family)